MRIIADENVPCSIVVWLRSQGNNVLYAAESRIQTSDIDLLGEAEDQGAVVLTEDKDFGDLSFRDKRNSHGVILLRMGNSPVARRLARLQTAWPAIESKLPGQFIVVTEKKLRMRPLPSP